MAKGAKYRRRSKPKTAKFKKSRQTTKPSPAFKVKVKKVMRSQEETKMAYAQIVSKVLHNSPINTQADWYRVYPQLGQTTDANARIGNEVYPTRLQLDLDISLRAADDRGVDLTVVVLIAKSIAIRGTPQGSVNGTFLPFAEYFKTDEATVTAFDGTVNTVDFPWNNEQVKGIARKTFRLSKGGGLNTGQNNHPSQPNDGFSDSPYCMLKKLRFNLPVPKILKYDPISVGSGSAFPNNDHYYYAVGYYYNNVDVAPDVLIGQALIVNARSRLYYKDG